MTFFILYRAEGRLCKSEIRAVDLCKEGRSYAKSRRCEVGVKGKIQVWEKPGDTQVSLLERIQQVLLWKERL